MDEGYQHTIAGPLRKWAEMHSELADTRERMAQLSNDLEGLERVLETLGYQGGAGQSERAADGGRFGPSFSRGKTSNMMILSHKRGFTTMADSLIYQGRAKNILRSELKRRGCSYKQLAEALAGLGIEETDRNIANKISRGAFTAAFFIACLEAIGCKDVRIGTE